MTSPKLTRSQRQSFFALIVNPMRSPQLVSAAKTFAHFYFLSPAIRVSH
jgi:hypothetical protein